MANERRVNQRLRNRAARRGVALAWTMTAMLAGWSLGQQGDKTPPGRVTTGRSIPDLPAESAKAIAESEQIVSSALNYLEDVDQIGRAIPHAEKALALRVSFQGESWWETQDARYRLADLRR